MRRTTAWCIGLALAILAGPGTAAASFVTLYGTDGQTGNLIQVDPNTGVGTIIGSLGFPVPALAVHPTTGVLYAGQGAGLPNVYTVDPATGKATLVGNSGLGFSAIAGMDFRADGTLFAAVNIVGNGGTGGETLATINPVTGLATVVGAFGVSGIEALAFSPSGVLYGASTVRGTGLPDNTLFLINPLTGQATAIGAILNTATGAGLSGGVTALEFDADGTLFAGTARALGAGTDGGRLITIDPTTGAFSFVGGVGATQAGRPLAALAGIVIPEPAGIALFGLGAVGLVGYVARRWRPVKI